jgi:U3 small nucleolar RNA-associated protein 11
MSMRNLIKTRTYRERSQPQARQHFGLLEKKKDYVLRAKDFHRKEDAIKSMKEKAAFKNPDEFYFKMAHTKMVDGVHRKASSQQPTHDEMRSFKKEDASYLMLKQTAEAKKIERLRANLHMLDAPLQNKHTIFADDEAAARELDTSGERSTALAAAALPPVKRRAEKRRREQSQEGDDADGGASADADDGPHAGGSAGPAAKKLRKKQQLKLEAARAAQYSELEQRVARHGKMGAALQRISTEKALMGKGARRKLKPKSGQEGAPRQFKWKQRRTK